VRTKFDPNEIIVFDSHAEIILYDRHNAEKARAIIDTDSVPAVSGTKWYLRPDGYVATNKYKENGYAYLHSVLLGNFGGKNYGDHADGDRLNNRMRNLRIATPSENGMNKRIRSNNTSGRTGIHWSKQSQKWCAMICYEGRHINLGYFDDFDKAVQCRRDAEEKYFGEYAPQEERVTL